MQGFRSDINALRAFAVLAVIAYHFGIFKFQGGFVGVDVFFVISGYLMTAIVVQALQQQRFSFVTFYLARARRIVPALWVLCVFLLAMGALLVPVPQDYVMLAKHVYKAMLFVSNNTFYQESGYFAAHANEKWVLHTWSLSVEWQFYLLYPLVLWAAWRCKPTLRGLNAVLIVLGLASFTCNLILSRSYPEYAFFMLPTRAWELVSGGLLYTYTLQAGVPSKWRPALQYIGLLLLTLTVFTYNSTLAWPSFWALLPVVATLMVMAAQRENRLLQQTWLQWCGSVSYSLYLWHWPIWVGLHYYGVSRDLWAIAAGLLLTLLLGTASFYGVEQPVRQGLSKYSARKSVAVLLSMVLVVYVGAWVVRQNDGFTGRLSPYLQMVHASIGNSNPREDECQGNDRKDAAGCQYGGETLGLIVMGDSHAQAVIRATEQALPSKQYHVSDWTMAGCPPLLGLHSTDVKSRCAQHLNKYFELQKTMPRNVPILLVARYSNYIEGPSEWDLQGQEQAPEVYFGQQPYAQRTPAFYHEMDAAVVRTACELARYRPVYMLKPIPEMTVDVPKYVLKRSWLGLDAQVQLPTREYQQRQQRILHSMAQAQQQCGVKLLDPAPILCHQQVCASSDARGRPYYYDDDHLSVYGAEQLLPLFRTMFAKP
ncbi:acyltransferase [Vitreoscilla massiliensis]|uniref:Acyltransferase n=1 Tax=Vitreoscilla massiliensis TaxID=1689272 RepID=A0ABY4DWB7_9NEIS|nr:acyltransferase family protein [Vitreoscilla massiliensis]UOO87806.1 acyltransferase [Vitreoscilla massiliensis]